jgi:predicted NBD/HSP70 family sugar kinase
VQLPTFDDILRLVQQNDARAIAALEHMAHHLGLGLAMLSVGLAPDVILIIGEITQAWDRVGPTVEKTVKARVPTPNKTRVMACDPSMQARLRGTIALVLQKHFGVPTVV